MFETKSNMQLIISFPTCKFEKHVLELKFFFSIFLQLNQIKIKKAGLKLQAYVILQILCNLWIQSETQWNICQNFKIWKQRVSIFFTFYYKPSCLEINKHKCYLLRQLLPKKSFVFKITWKMLPKSTKSVRNCQHPILWRDHQN